MNKVDGAKRVSKIPHPILNVFKPKSKTHHKTLESKFRARLSTADDPWASDKRRWHMASPAGQTSTERLTFLNADRFWSNDQ